MRAITEVVDNKIVLKSFNSSVSDYSRSIRGFVYALWNGTYTYYDFIDSMVGAIERNFTKAWQEGAAECGILPEELTQEELTTLRNAINSQYTYLVDFANEIYSHRKADGAKLGPHHARAAMWVNRYGEIYNQAMQMACGDKKLKWVWNPIKEHCVDCATLNGRIYRASTWERYHLRPRSHELACRGYRCGCSFEPTDERANRGRPPSISGG